MGPKQINQNVQVGSRTRGIVKGVFIVFAEDPSYMYMYPAKDKECRECGTLQELLVNEAKTRKTYSI